MAEAKRQMAAIMFTDLMGYTALTERNEPAALELVKKNRDLHQTTIEKNHGQLVKELGDGFLATFENTVDALACARKIQMEAKARDFEIPVRIGIHYGDITIENGDIFGHGVNMASRIQSIADPGGVYVSESIKKQIPDKDGSETQYMGAVPLKNIKDPVPVYALKGNGLPSPEKRRIERIIRRAIYLKYSRNVAIAVTLILIAVFIWFIRTYDIERALITKTVAVLPLENLSEDFVEEYLSASLTNELIRELSKVSALTVIDQKSTRQYAGISKTFSEISRELNDTNYLVDGTFLIQNEQIQLEIRLIDPNENQVIWRKDYEQPISTSRQLWTEATQDMTLMMGVFVPDDNAILWGSKKPVDPETYELYLKGMYELEKDTRDPEKGLKYLNEAVERNPADAYVWAGIATAHIYMGHRTRPGKEDRQRARAAAMRALQLDSTLAQAWSALATVKAYYDWDWKGAEQAYRKANSLNPSLPWNRYHYSWYLVLFGRMDEAIREHKKAKELNPFSPVGTAWLGYIYMMVGEYDKAIREAKLAMEMKNKVLGSMMLAEIYSSMGRLEEALEINQQLLNEYPLVRYSPFLAKEYILSGNIEMGKQILDEWDTKLDTIPSAYGAYLRAEIYTALGDNDNAFKWYEFEPHHHWVPWVRVRWNMPCVKDSSFIKDPRFKELMRRMNLPDPAPFQYDPELDL